MSTKTNLYFEAVEAQDRQAADIYFTRLVTEALDADPCLLHEEARKLVNLNIGYTLGYLSDETRVRCLELYPEAEHPILGRTFGDLGPDVLLAAGMAYAKSGLAAARKVIANARAEADCAGASDLIEMINRACK
jgi:hypothetical protein